MEYLVYIPSSSTYIASAKNSLKNMKSIEVIFISVMAIIQITIQYKYIELYKIKRKAAVANCSFLTTVKIHKQFAFIVN